MPVTDSVSTSAEGEAKASGPAYSFGGKGVSRDPADRIRTTYVPGPGTYDTDNAIGTQNDSRRITAAATRFPISDRDAAGKVYAGTPTLEFVCSPGPGAYDVKSPMGATADGAPQFSFARGRYKKRDQREKSQHEDKRISPGPGEYNHNSALSARYCTFGSSSRDEFKNHYSGPGMPQGSDSRCHAGYVSGMSSLGGQMCRPSSPAFSFGKKTAPGIMAGGASARPTTTPTGKGASIDMGIDRPASVPGGRDRRKTVKYDWLRGGSKQQPQKNRYQKAVDGADMPRANEYVKAPMFSFGKDERFSDRIYIPHKPVVRSGTTPGPIYELPESIGQAPSYSFPRVSDRTHPDAKRAEKEKRPGPGAYNIRLEHRVEALLSEAESSMMLDANSLTQSMDEDGNLAPETSLGLPKSSTLSSQMTSVTATANELGLKFGDIPTAGTSPAFSFGTGDRQTRAKLYGVGDLNKEFAGKWSPGPVTAIRDMHDGRPKSPEFSFGGRNTIRNPQLKASSEVGPAQFGSVNAVGKQLDSTSRTAPNFSFETSDRAKIKKMYTPGAPAVDESVPGPIYFASSDVGLNSVGKQLSSVKLNAPNFTFGSSKRDQIGKLYMPQSVGKKLPRPEK